MQFKGSRLASSHKTQEGIENGCIDDNDNVSYVYPFVLFFLFFCLNYFPLVALDGFINNLFYR